MSIVELLLELSIFELHVTNSRYFHSGVQCRAIFSQNVSIFLLI